jgi:hypothetical protein
MMVSYCLNVSPLDFSAWFDGQPASAKAVTASMSHVRNPCIRSLFISFLDRVCAKYDEIAVDCSSFASGGICVASGLRYSVPETQVCAARAGDTHAAQ